jgi:hypothetical protein
MHNLSGGRILLTQTMVQMGNLVHTANRDCFVTLYLQKCTSLEIAEAQNNAAENNPAADGTNSLRISIGSSPNAIYIRNANCGTRPILENIPLQNGESLRISCTVPTRHIVYGYSINGN